LTDLAAIYVFDNRPNFVIFTSPIDWKSRRSLSG
jgi:hypothetical protein